MISTFDRSWWLGASDTRYVMAENQATKSWHKWWAIKCGIKDSMFGGSIYTEMGNLFEHPILMTIDEKMNTDRQLKLRKFNLRVNYDGDIDGVIYEVKTHRADKPFEVSKAYYQQAQVEMYCWKEYIKESAIYKDYHTREHLEDLKGLYIVSYGLNVDEYNQLEAYKEGKEIVIDLKRIEKHKIKYDRGFISSYKPRLKKLTKALRGDGIPW